MSPSEPAAFYRLSGAGNDFLALAEPPEDPSPERIRAWCQRGVSAGADGLFVLCRSGAESVAMRYFNADGYPAELCLNGTRCAAALAFHLGWGKEEVAVATGAGRFTAQRRDGDRIALELTPPTGPPEPASPEVDGRVFPGWRVAVGVPHFVLLWPGSLARAPVSTLGPALRRHPAFGDAGANVHFVRFPAPGRMEIRSFERGVEAETLACGTGVLAATLAGLGAEVARLPLVAQTAGGFALEVTGTPAEGYPHRWSLIGDARLVAQGELLPGAMALPSPTSWSE